MRLWITGLGIVTPLGVGAQLCMDRICDAQRAFDRVRVFDGSAHKVQLVSEVTDLAELPLHGEVRPARTEAMAIQAAREALAHARLRPGSDPVDLVFGTTTAATFEIEERLAALFDRAPVAPLDPAFTDTLALSTERIVEALGPFARVRTVSSACSTGAMALLLAASWIRSGRSTRVLAGAADGLCRLTLTGFNALGSLDASPCRPFDRSRGGLSLGEGAAFLVIERDDVAAARGVSPIAELGGWGAGAEAHHITNPEPSGRTPTRLARHALSMAGLSPADVDYVNAHGTATALNDPMEIQALRTVFGHELDRVYVSSTKGQIGHTLGAAGAIEAAICALAIQQGRVPPTAGLQEPDDPCRAHHVIGAAVQAPVRAALTNSFGFGGLDTVLLLSRPSLAAEQPEPAQPRTVLLAGAAVGPLGVLDTRAAYAYLDAGEIPRSGAVEFDDALLLDRARARRLGRAERLLAAAIGHAIDQAGGMTALGDPQQMGIVASRLSGNPGPTARFLAKARDRGPRFASPADFPNLMLSSIAGHESIYHGLQGPALAIAERHAAGAAAFLTAAELLSGGCADIMIAGSSDDWDIGGQANPLRSISGIAHEVPSTEGASAVLLCRDDHPAARDSSRLVKLDGAVTWSHDDARQAALDSLPAPASNAVVVTSGGPDPAWIPASWCTVRRVHIESRTGWHDAISGMAIVAAMSAVASGRAASALVLARGAFSGYAFVLGAP